MICLYRRIISIVLQYTLYQFGPVMQHLVRRVDTEESEEHLKRTVSTLDEPVLSV